MNAHELRTVFRNPASQDVKGTNINRNRIIWFLFSIVLVEAIVSIPELNLELALRHRSPFTCVAGFLIAALAVFVGWRFRTRIAAGAYGLGERLSNIPRAGWLFGCAVTGALLRLSWMVVYPAPQRSDFATYVELARDLLETHRYGSPHVGLAFWPPGYPILLYLHFLIFGVHSWVPAICNYILFLCTLFAVDRIATRIVGAHAGRVGTLLLLFWPEFFTSGWLASKELLVASLLPLSLLAYFNSAADRPRKAQVAWLILAGMMLGFAGLGQPSMVLFPIVFLICDWLRKENFIWSTARLACTVSAILLVILPWTVRNHRVLGEWILVSSNGGSVFYRANNELATGGFTQSGSYEFERLDEVSKSRLGYKMAGDWIRRNPAQFLVLALRKQVLFLGDDSTGVYETLKRGIGMSGLEYAAWKGISNAYWLAIWIFILAGIAVHWNAPVSSSGEVSALMLGVLYLYSIHSVFESNGKYHLPLIGLFAVLASVSSSSGPSKNQRRGATT